MEYIHILIDFFANGKSEMKVYLFFVFLIIIILTKKISKNTLKKTNNLRKIIISLMIILYSLNLGSFLYFYKLNDITYFSSIYVYNNNEVSSTNILHNHTLKSPIGFLLYKVGLNPVQEYVDTGYAFTPFFSNVFLYLVLILLLIFVLCIILYAKKEKQTFIQTIIFSIVSFSVIKNILDGGVFHNEAILAITCFLILLTNNSIYDRKKQQINLIIFLIYITLGTYIAFMVSEQLSARGNVFLENFMIKFLFFFPLILLYYKNQIKTKLVIFASLPIIILVCNQYLLLIKDKYQKEITEVFNSQQIVVYAKKPISNTINVESEIDLGNTSIVKGYLKKNTKESVLIKELGFEYNFMVYGLPYVSCDYSEFNTYDYITRLNYQNLTLDHELLKIHKIDNLFSVKTNACLNITPGILTEVFKKNNINSIILIQNGKSIN